MPLLWRAPTSTLQLEFEQWAFEAQQEEACRELEHEVHKVRGRVDEMRRFRAVVGEGRAGGPSGGAVPASAEGLARALSAIESQVEEIGRRTRMLEDLLVPDESAPPERACLTGASLQADNTDAAMVADDASSERLTVPLQAH